MARTLDLDEMWDVQTTARKIGIKKTTLYCWRTQGKGPVGRKVHGNLYYVPSEVRQWVRLQFGM